MTNSTEYDLGAIRKLLSAAFTAIELRRFCQEHPEFRPVVASFGADDSLGVMIDRVMEYCETQVLFSELLKEIRADNPRQYKRHATNFGETGYEPAPDSEREGSPEPGEPPPTPNHLWTLFLSVAAVALALLNLLRDLFDWQLPWSPLVGWILVGLVLLGLATVILFRRRPARAQLLEIIKDWRTWLSVCIAVLLLVVLLWIRAGRIESTLLNREAALNAALATASVQATDIASLQSAVQGKQAEVTSALATVTAQAAELTDLEKALRAREDALMVGGLVRHFDFEESAEGWEEMVKWEDKFKNPQRITNAAMLRSEQIERGVTYDVQLQQGAWLNYTIQYEYPVWADLIVAQFYLPDIPDIANNWVGIAAIDPGADRWLAAAGKAIPKGKWTQLVLDLRDRYDLRDQPLAGKLFNLQAVYLLEGDRPLRSSHTVVGLDEVAWYRESGQLSINEQRGEGRTLFDFEDEDLARWRTLAKPGSSGILSLSSAPVYRGERALRWDLEIGDGATAYLETKLTGLAPNGGWVARVYLPDNIPDDVSLWASLHTTSRLDWEDSKEITLVPGLWNTLIWDTHEVDWGRRRDITFGIQVGAEGGSYQGSLHVDDVQIFEQ